jgi:exopolysaccharide biosynthesis polyprenyl glycosylphosphotransferase
VVGKVKIIGHLGHFQEIISDHIVDEVIFALPLKNVPKVNWYIKYAETVGAKIRIIPDWQIQQIMFRPETASISFDTFVGGPTLVMSSTPQQELAQLIKSFFDYSFASLWLIILSPVFLLISILIKLSSKGPVFFHQERVSTYGRRFYVHKFRTMVENAEELKSELKEDNEMDGPVFKMKNDPRITKIGRFLRKTSLDELPQLFNVMRGDMSMVGPRPALPSEVKLYKPAERRRLSMKPGITCIWQVSNRNETSFEDWMKMDLHYIDNWSLMLDAKLLLQTVGAVFRCTGR